MMLSIIFVAWVLLMYVAYLELYPFEPLTINNIELMTSRVRAGDNLLVEVDVCKNLAYPSTISKYMEDGLIYGLPSFTTNSEVGCKKYVTATEIPTTLPPGIYKLHVVYSYHIGFRDVRVEYETEDFEVIAR